METFNITYKEKESFFSRSIIIKAKTEGLAIKEFRKKLPNVEFCGMIKNT